MANEAGKSKAIGNHTYYVRKLLAGEGLQGAARLMNLLGPGVKSVNGGDGESLAAVVSGIMSDTKLGDHLKYFTDLFAKQTEIVQGDGKRIELVHLFDVHFSGEYFALLQWLVFCFEVNFGNFLGDLGLSVQSLVGMIQAQLNSRSQKAPGTSGPSGISSSQASSTKPSTT